MHAQNWSQPTDPLTQGSLGVSFSLEQDIWQVEFLYVPLQTHPQLPSKKSPWWPRQKRFMIESEDTELLLGEDIEYQIADIEIIEDADRNNSTLLLKQKSESFESQFVFYNGLAMNPFLLTELNAQVISIDPKQILLLESPILLKPLGYRHTVLAATFLIPFETWSIKGGAQWLYGPDGTLLNTYNDYDSASFAINYNW